MEFENIVKKQLEIEDRVVEEFKKFKKSNTERKLQILQSVYEKIKAEKVTLDENNNYLVSIKSQGLASKQYFKENFYGRIESIFKDFFNLIKSVQEENKYLVLRDTQVEIQENLKKLSADWKNLDSEEKVKEKEVFLLKNEQLKSEFAENHKKLDNLRNGREQRSYFCQESLTLFEKQIEQFKSLVEDEKEDDKSSSSEDNRTKTSEGKMGEDARLENMESALAELIKLNVSKTKNSINSLCTKFIIRFDPKNVRSFLNSVQDCLDECEEDEVKKVLRYAKNRVTNNAIVSATEFDSFEEFEQLLNQQFKPVKDHLQVNHEISMLLQKREENVTQFGARAVLLKVEYIEALFSYYKAKNEKLPLTRMQEAETLVTKHFILGLKRETKINIRSEPNTLTEAIGFAEAAATAASLAEVSRNAAENKNAAGTNRYRGNSRGGWQPRGNRGGANGRQGNGGPGFSGHHSSSEVNAQAQSATSESKGCWICGDENHRKFECPNKASVARVGRGGFSQPKNRPSASSVQSAQAMQNMSQRDSE